MRAEVGFCTGPTVKTFTPFLKIDLPSHFKVFISIFEDYFTHKNLRAPLEILFYQNPAALGRNPQRGSPARSGGRKKRVLCARPGSKFSLKSVISPIQPFAEAVHVRTAGAGSPCRISRFLIHARHETAVAACCWCCCSPPRGRHACLAWKQERLTPF